MLKKLGILLILALICAASVVFYVYFTRPSQFAPYPYLFTKENYTDQLSEVEGAHVLIVGDRLGKDYSRFQKTLEELTSQNLQVPLKIISWARLHEGSHRTLEKLRALKKWPKVIIFFGASEEYFEQNFFLENIPTIKKNFELFHDSRYSTVLYAVPKMAKFLYQKINWVRLDETVREDLNEYDSTAMLKKIEMKYFLFAEHLKEMTRLADINHSKIIFVTTPINFLAAPKKTCESSRHPELESKMAEIKPLIENGQSKVAYGLMKPLMNSYTGNAELFYLFGKVAMDLGEKSLALDSLHKAAIFDCAPFRGNLVYNKIMLDVAQTDTHPLIDFEALVSSHLLEGDAFIDDTYVQNTYYQLLTTDLSKIIKHIFQI